MTTSTKMLSLCWFLIVSSVVRSQSDLTDVKLTTKNDNEISSKEISDNKLTSYKEGKELTPSFPDDVDILNSDYFDDPKTSTSVYFQENEPEEVEVVEEEIKPVKAPCLGCPEDSDPGNSKIKDVALFAFSEYSKGISGDDQAQQFVQVTKAQTQVVAGIKYILEVEIGWSNCSKSEYDQDSSLCKLDPSKETFTCDFHVVEKSWLNSKEVVNAKCHKDQKSEPIKEEQIDDYEDLLDQISAEEGESVTESSTGSSKRRKRDTGNFGSRRNAEESQEVLADIAKFAVEQLDKIDDDDSARLVVDVIQAEKQTVSGWLYHLRVRVAQTTCKEGEDNTLEKCKDKIVLPFAICEVKVLFQPWQTNQKKLTESQCYQEKYKKSKKIAKQLFKRQNAIVKETYKKSKTPFGGSTSVDPDSQDVLELTTFAIDSLDQYSNALHAQKLVRVISAKRQLVAGVLTTLEVEVGYTTCRKHPTLDKSKCDIDENREHQFCNLTIVEKPWLKERKLTGSKCGKRESNPEPELPTTAPSTKRKRGAHMFSSEHDADHVEFGKFIDKYEKNYDTETEFKYRLGVYKENMRKVKLLQENEQGTATYGATRFADLTEEEFTKMHLGFRTDLRRNIKRKQAKIPVLTKIPDEFDWRHYNAVTPVKNQGSCGSCWAFSVSGNIEGANAIKHGSLISLSEQELVDCDTLDEGCNGGLPENAYKVLEKLGGLETENEYPYEGRDEKCHFNSKLAKVKVSGFVEISKNETEMAAWLVKNGPISIGINANAMQFYFGGVSHPWKFLCSPKNLDHGVLIVGYGVHTTSIRHKTLPYWLVKNSWGPGWGEQGYYRVYRGDGTCGLNQMATSALVV